MGTMLWWIANVVVVVAVFPLVALLALRIIGALGTVQRAAEDIRSSLQVVVGNASPAMSELTSVASRCEQLASRVPA